MRHDGDKKAIGQRLQAARKAAGLTQQQVADKLSLVKATVSSWEVGTNQPDLSYLKQLAKIYGVSADALLWDDSLSIEAMQFAAEFDALTERQRRTFRVLWSAFVLEATADARVEQTYGRRPDLVVMEPGRTYVMDTKVLVDAQNLSENRAVRTLTERLLETLVAEKREVEAELVRKLQQQLGTDGTSKGDDR